MAAKVTSDADKMVTTTVAPVANGESGKSLNVFSSESSYAVGLRMAKAWAASTLVPAAYQNNPANVLIAMEIAFRIGCSIFAAMQNLDPISGRPSWRSTFLIATVNSSGKFTPLRYRWEGAPYTDAWGCRAVAKDAATGEECVGTLISLSMAKAEGWYGRSGSKWKTMPEQMLMYRAAAFWTRIYCPELSLGMQTSEEAADTEGFVPRLQQAPAQVSSLEAAILGAPAPPSAPDLVTEDGEVVEPPTREPGED